MSNQNNSRRDQINTVSANLENGPPPQYEHFIKARINPDGNNTNSRCNIFTSFILFLAIFLDSLPPSYESLYSKFKNAHRSFRQNVEHTNIYSLNENDPPSIKNNSKLSRFWF